MVEYSKINCKLTNVQLNKLKKSVKSNEGATLRLGIKSFNEDELPYELLLTNRQNTKLRNAINKPLGLRAAMSAIDESIQKKIHGSGIKLIIEEEDMKDIMKIIEALENSGIL